MQRACHFGYESELFIRHFGKLLQLSTESFLDLFIWHLGFARFQSMPVCILNGATVGRFSWYVQADKIDDLLALVSEGASGLRINLDAHDACTALESSAARWTSLKG